MKYSLLAAIQSGH